MIWRTSWQHAGLSEQHARAPLLVGKITRWRTEARSETGSASILLALAGMLPASRIALGFTPPLNDH